MQLPQIHDLDVNAAKDLGLLTEAQLAKKWQVSIDKLRMDRWKKVGCPYLKLGRLVRYSMNDVLSFEDSMKVNPKG
jgi:hypothetical protein